MKIRCTRCGSFIDETAGRCPFCGATNENIKRTGNGVPTTIDELKSWYVAHNLPDEEITRFFIGKNYQGPKAFGIYKDDFSGDFIVYKNKKDGSRAIRYQGRDETYAVNEIYMKLKEEMNLQKARNITEPSISRVSHQTSYESSKRGVISKGFIIFVIFIVIVAIGTLFYVQSKSPLNRTSNIAYENDGTNSSKEVDTTQGTTSNDLNDSGDASNDTWDSWPWLMPSYSNSSYDSSDTWDSWPWLMPSYSNSSYDSSDTLDSWPWMMPSTSKDADTTQGSTSNDLDDNSYTSNDSWLWWLPSSSNSGYDSSSDYSNSWGSYDDSDSWSSYDSSDSWSSSDYSDSWDSSDWSSSDWDSSWDSSDSWSSDYSDWSSDW